jgi:gamma-glutamylcyclotransferase (GGCT)/AIG2-like uncharacterized protein YtfP
MQGRGARVEGRGEVFFFYGTLTDLSALRRVIGDADAFLIGPARVYGTLYDTGEYPALVLSGRAEVPGFLVDVQAEAVAALDAYEGVAEGLYSRRQIIARTAGGERSLAWTYVYERSVAGLCRIERWDDDRIDASGDLAPSVVLQGDRRAVATEETGHG